MKKQLTAEDVLRLTKDILEEHCKKTGKEAEKFDEQFNHLINNMNEPAKAVGVTDKQLAHVYSEANRYYKSGQYVKAIRLFQWLRYTDVKEPNYLFGMAASMQMLKKYEEAITLYLMMAELDPKNPIPYYHIVDCYVKQDCDAFAAVMAQRAVVVAGEQPTYQTVKERCSLFLKSTIEKLSKENKEKQKEFTSAVETIKKKLDEQA